MANRARGEVALALGGKTFVLRPSFGVVCEIEDAVGASLFEIGRKLERVDITARELVGVAHACLEHCGYPFERAELGELIVRDGTRATLVALVEFCRNYAFGGREKKKDADPPTSKEARAVPRNDVAPS